MKAPQIIYLILTGIGMLRAANRHGKPKTGNENLWADIVATIIVLFLLFWGGFFK